MVLLPLLALHAAVTTLVIHVNAIRNARALRRLPKRAETSAALPSLCVFVPARNEERAIRQCLESLLAQDYPGGLRIIAIDDQSEDRTGAIILALAAKHPGRLQALRTPPLPEGWMGKNHALWHGVAHAPAEAEWYLFTDADIIFAPGVLRRAAALAQALRADHLFLTPLVRCRGFWEQVVLPLGYHIMMISVNPRRIEDPSRREYFGVGAFNLIRRSLYEREGGHAAIRGEVIDDVALGKLTKEAGARLRVASAGADRSLRMYDSLGSIVRGFRKNIQAGIGGGLIRSAVVVLAQPFLALAPLAVAAANLIAEGGSPLLAALAIAWQVLGGLLILRNTARAAETNPWVTALCYPLGYLVIMWIAASSAYWSLVRREIPWRGRVVKRPEQTVRVGL
ncbi:MAG: glycosyltransferase [Candidatus Sumerlaeia bacterium]|nr:glycosyltransferase [Candidatus Sumerlaeia bacterium]